MPMLATFYTPFFRNHFNQTKLAKYHPTSGHTVG